VCAEVGEAHYEEGSIAHLTLTVTTIAKTKKLADKKPGAGIVISFANLLGYWPNKDVTKL